MSFVYTPPGYDRETKRRYPVLWLQHGAGESERGWTAQGRANFILDNLIAEGKAVPMIIVMENGYATPAGATPPQTGARGNESFSALVIQDLIPEIDAACRTLARRESRAIAGLSMDAGQAMQTGLAHLDLLAWVGAFSGGVVANFDAKTAFAGAFADPGAVNKKIRLLWLGYGELDARYATGKAMHEALEKAGIRHVWFEGPGSHEWQVWRKHLHDFAPRLFR